MKLSFDDGNDQAPSRGWVLVVCLVLFAYTVARCAGYVS